MKKRVIIGAAVCLLGAVAGLVAVRQSKKERAV